LSKDDEKEKKAKKYKRLDLLKRHYWRIMNNTTLLIEYAKVKGLNSITDAFKLVELEYEHVSSELEKIKKEL